MNSNPQTETVAASVDAHAKKPTQYTIEANQNVPPESTFPDDKHDYSSAERGFIGTLNANGQVVSTRQYNAKIEGPPAVWNLGNYSFLTPPTPSLAAPATVNPSLWRQAKINMNNGLFKVTSRTYDYNGQQVTRSIYQVRAFDLSNMTIVETDTGIIVIDPLVSRQTAAAALNLYTTLVNPALPVKAVIYTHSHIDHYGGVLGVVDPQNVGNGQGQVPILAPDGFLDHAISENAFAGNAMGRRAGYMYGIFLLKNALGEVDCGLGKALSTGDSGLIAPTQDIKQNLDERDIDGVKIVFQLAQDTEAPSEMLFHFPQFKALCAAEDMTHNLHNVYSIRGSQVRDAMAWWKVINDAIQLFANDTDVIFAQHHWPIWRDDSDIVGYLKKQRDLYKYLLDQSLRMLNHGHTMIELAERMVLPKSLADKWYNRGYYGTVNHDTKAIYQRYLGWYDANPAHLHTLPPVESSVKFVEYMGGARSVLDRAKKDYQLGQYRWVAEVVNQVIFADPNSNNANPTGLTLEAKQLQADALEQMGYQAESGPWRNAYLMGASELRHGKSPFLAQTAPLTPSVVSAMTLDNYFDYMGLRFNAPEAEAASLTDATINWIVTPPVIGGSSSTTEYYSMEFMDYTLPYTSYDTLAQLPASPPAINVTIGRDDLNSLAIVSNPKLEFDAMVKDGRIHVQGDKDKVMAILGLLDMFPANFNIVTP